MALGIQLVAREGYLSMKKGEAYHLLRNDPREQRVLLVRFYDQGGSDGRRSELVIMSRSDFQAGLCPVGQAPAAIVTASPQATLPPWISDLSGFQFDTLPGFGLPAPGKSKCAKDEVERRVLQLQPALDDINAILQSDDPDFALNCHARRQSPEVNETRHRLWFYLYVAFGYNLWALLPPRSQWGKWDRLDPEYAGTSPGRAASTDEGRHFSSRTTLEMVDKILEGFHRFMSPNTTLTAAWASTIRLIFGAHIKRKRGGIYEARHPKGLPLPSFGKFYYYTRKLIDPDVYRRIVMGDKVVGMDEQPVGKQQHWMLYNIGERGHFDSTHIKDLPIGLLTKQPLPAMQMVILVDPTTGHIEGIGFSIGAEEVRAYKLALFCAAIPKTKFGEIIGVTISPEDWSSQGLPAALFSDRGCGASAELNAAIARWRINLTMPPSYTPPANSTVEAKHQRRKRQKGAAEHRLSNLTVPVIIKRETLRVIKKNHSDSAIDKASEGAIMAGAATPAEYRNYLDERHCTSLIQIPFHEAVRAFLDKVTFTVKNGRLYFQGRLYWSDEVADSGLAHAMKQGKDMRLDGYMYQPATRLGWVEFNGRLIEVKVQPRPDPQLELLSLPEADELGAAYSRASGMLQRRKKLEEVATQDTFKEETGKELLGGTTKSGRPKNKTDQATDEVKRLTSTT